MSWWGALAGGLIGTVVLTTGLRLAQELGWTRMDIPLLLGTIFTDDRDRASMFGYALHFVNGLLFSVGYAFVFWATGHAGWLFGAALGAVHAGFAGTALVNLLLPAVHPRMGSRWTDAEETPILEPPGFMLENYGRRTMLGSIVAHMLYGRDHRRLRRALRALVQLALGVPRRSEEVRLVQLSCALSPGVAVPE